MRLQHPIFKGPLEPGLILDKTPTPKDYRHHPGGEDLPEALDTWKIQEGSFPKDVDAGLVSSPYGFSDSPDAEIISSGINTKGPRSVALGRHGNLFLWGFSGDPRQMTESARRVFVNAVVYMKQFDGRRPLIDIKGRSREWGASYIAYASTIETESTRKSWLKRYFPEEATSELGAVERYYHDNLEFLHPGGEGWAADPDLKALGVSNRQTAFFEAIQAKLQEDGKDPLALRLLDRYVGLRGLTNRAELKKWLDENREHLFFSDVGGYRWYVDTHAKAAAKKKEGPAETKPEK